MGTGLFCVFEGIDGSGKSTLLGKTAESLGERLPEPPVLLREPTDGPAGKKIRQLLTSGGSSLSAAQWLELFVEDRHYNRKTWILPALEQGKVVLQDRYYYSTAAYQNSPLLPAREILDRHRSEGFPDPDLLFYISIPVRVALERIRTGRSSTEYFETEEKLTRIQEIYESSIPPTARVLDGTLPPDRLAKEVAETILRELSDRRTGQVPRG